MSTKITMSSEEIKARVEDEYDAGSVSAVDLRAIERYLDKVEYHKEYNRKPEVKAKRKAYNEARRAEEKAGRQLIAQLMARKAELGK